MPDTATAPTATNAQTRIAGARLLGFYPSGGAKIDCLHDPANFAMLDANGKLDIQAPNVAGNGAYSASFQTNYDRQGNVANRRILFTADSFRSTIQAQYFSGSWSAGDLLLGPDGGNIAVGTASPSAKFHVNGTNTGQVTQRIDSVGTADTLFIGANSGGSSGDAVYVMSIRTAGTLRGGIQWNGSSLLYNTSSDHRLKEDLKPLEGALERILSLPVYDFAWKETGLRTRGFLAHEFGAVIPGSATGEKDAMREEEIEIEPARASDIIGADGTPVIIPAVTEKQLVPDYQGIDQSKAVPDLVRAVQELHAIVMAQAAEIDVLKGAR